MKPWAFGEMVLDGYRNRLVFQDRPEGTRYTVHLVQPNGAHVRHVLGPPRYTGPTDTFEVHAPTSRECDDLARVYVASRSRTAVREGASLTGGEKITVMTYREESL